MIIPIDTETTFFKSMRKCFGTAGEGLVLNLEKGVDKNPAGNVFDAERLKTPLSIGHRHRRNSTQYRTEILARWKGKSKTLFTADTVLYVENLKESTYRKWLEWINQATGEKINKQNPFTLSSLLAIVWILSYMKPRAQVGGGPRAPSPRDACTTATSGNSLAMSWKFKHKLIIQPNNSSPRTVPRKREPSVHTETCMRMFPAALE